MAIPNSPRSHATPPTFNQLLKSLRTAAGLTQEELAERASVSARLISDLERGKIQRSRRDTIQMLADGLGLAGEERDTFTEIARGRPGTAQMPPATDSLVRQVNLPLPPTGIVGREREVTATVSLLHQPEVRLLTLTGPGGVGKTRLALEAAARVAETFRHGVVFVDLAPVAESSLVIPIIARSLGLRDQGESVPLEQLVTSLQGMQLLVVLDNLEHLVAVAAELARLLERCPGLTLLATSRQPLRVRAEREYPVPPLTLPDLDDLPSQDDLSRIPAVDLFVRRAESARPSFALNAENARAVAEIAVRLDGLPLAIELAAARVRVLSPAELLARLERRLPLLTGGATDLPVRQQTLRATIDWSHELLNNDERRLFRRMAVFAAGFMLEAAEYVGAHEDLREDGPHDVLDVLTSLVNRSLLRTRQTTDSGQPQATTRFGMLETIREYGLECLVAAGEEAEARARHAGWCVNLAERAEPELTGPDQAQWFACLELEHDNIRAALAWAIEQDDSETALRLCSALYRFWVTEALFAEGRGWIERALSLDDVVAGKPKGNALLGLGVIVYFQGDYEHAEACTQTALETFGAIQDKTGVAYCYGNLGLFADVQKDYASATERYERALALFRELDDQTHAGFMLGNLGLIAYLQGDYDRAAALHQETLAIVLARGDDNSASITLGNLALVALARGDYEQAESLQREALERRKKVVNKSHLARNFDHFAIIATVKHELERAALLFGAADALRTEIGAPLQPSDQEFNERYITDVRTQMGSAAFASAWEAGSGMQMDDVTTYALRDQHARPPIAASRHHADS